MPAEYAMYLRKSRADEERERLEKFDTLKKHERALKELARRCRYPVVKVYKELVSGESIALRTEFRALMEEVAQRKYAGIIVHEVDRLGRGDMMEYGWILSTLQWTGTLVITPAKTYDPRNELDMQQLQMQMLFSNTELLRIKKRMKEGKEGAIEDGCYIGSLAPFGYDKVKLEGKRRSLIPNDKAPIVVQIYEDAARGMSVSAIANKLNRMGIRTVLGNEWTPTAVRQVINNPIYKGNVTWNKMVLVVDGREGMEYMKRRVKGENPMERKGLHIALVSEELWQRANDAIRPSPRKKKAEKLINPLAGVLKCAKCGRAMPLTMQKTKGKSYGYYRHAPYSSCSCEASTYAAMMDTVISALRSVAHDVEVSMSAFEDDAAARDQELEALLKEQASNSKRLDKIVELFTADALTLDEFRARRESLDERGEQLEERIRELREYVPPDPIRIVTTLHEAIDKLGDESIDCEARNALLKAIVEKIEYTKENGQISLEIGLCSV